MVDNTDITWEQTQDPRACNTNETVYQGKDKNKINLITVLLHGETEGKILKPNQYYSLGFVITRILTYISPLCVL
jgi:hypothetical protein